MNTTTTTHNAALINELVDAAHQLAALGLSPGTSGNVSVKIGDLIYLSATGSSMSSLTPEDLAVVSLDGTHLHGPKPTKEAPLHLAFYSKAESTRAVIHLHSTNAVAASCLVEYSPYSALPPITPYFVMRVGQAPLIPYFAPGSDDQAHEINAREFGFRAALLQNHGLIVAGNSVASATETAIELEAAAEVLVRLGTTVFTPLTDRQAHELSSRYSSWWDTEAR